MPRPRGAPLDRLHGEVAGRPPRRTLRRAAEGHALRVLGIWLQPLALPGVGHGPGIPHEVQHVEIHGGDHPQRATVRRKLGGVHYHPATRDGPNRPVEPPEGIQVLRQTSLYETPPRGRQHEGYVLGAGTALAQPYHLPGVHPARAPERLVHDRPPQLALAKRLAAAAGLVLNKTVLPDLAYLADRDETFHLAQDVPEQRAPAPPEPGYVEYLGPLARLHRSVRRGLSG